MNEKRTAAAQEPADLPDVANKSASAAAPTPKTDAKAISILDCSEVMAKGDNFSLVANNAEFRDVQGGYAVCSFCKRSVTRIADWLPSYHICEACFTEASRIARRIEKLERELSAERTARAQETAAYMDLLGKAQEPHYDEELGASYVPIPTKLHPDTAQLVATFAWRLAVKLRKAEQKYGYSNGWKDNGWMDECRTKLNEHVAKGDPIDVAAYCAFLMWHNERTAAPQDAKAIRAAAFEEAAKVCDELATTDWAGLGAFPKQYAEEYLAAAIRALK